MALNDNIPEISTSVLLAIFSSLWSFIVKFIVIIIIIMFIAIVVTPLTFAYYLISHKFNTSKKDFSKIMTY